eukprot:5909706-Pyramimonas_sp.AAC.1
MRCQAQPHGPGYPVSRFKMRPGLSQEALRHELRLCPAVGAAVDAVLPGSTCGLFVSLSGVQGSDASAPQA